MVIPIRAGKGDNCLGELVRGGKTKMTQKEAMPSPRALWKLAGISIVIFTVLFSTLLAVVASLQQEPDLGVVLPAPRRASAPQAEAVINPFPDTTDGIHVFSDQLAVWEMSEAQFEFAASHYAGTQKVFASDARRFRSYNPNFVILNYRLGMGLGYQGTTPDCKPDGVWAEVIEGEKRLREYPADPPDEWFFKWQGRRVFFCEWGWYVMEIGNPSWREYWSGEVVRQVRANAADGAFLDSLLPPNYYGADRFDPALPVVDQAFEEAWSSRIEEFIAYNQSNELAEYYLIPNVGAWITGRDATDYSGADGVMVEGFARFSEGNYFSAQDGDW
jgi:hypothetical protein